MPHGTDLSLMAVKFGAAQREQQKLTPVKAASAHNGVAHRVGRDGA